MSSGDLPAERWAPVRGFEGLYEVSDLGRVKRCGSAKCLKPMPNTKGYPSVDLKDHGRRKYAVVHRLVAETFIPKPDNKPQVNHKDGDKTNNAVSNLEWCTGLENIRHAVRTGLMDYAYMRSLIDEDKRIEAVKKAHYVPVIREDGKTYKSIADAAQDLGVTRSAVQMHLAGKTRKCKGHVLRRES